MPPTPNQNAKFGFLDPNKWTERVSILGVGFPRGVFYFIGAIVALTILIWVTGFALRSGAGKFAGVPGATMSSDSMNIGYGGGSTGMGGIAPPMAPTEEMGMAYDGGMNLRAVTQPGMMPYPVPGPDYSVGEDAEDFEVKTYDASIKTNDSEPACDAIAALKERTDVIFSYANQYEEGCQFNFKTTKESASEILAIVEGFDPESLSGRTESIKPRLDNYTSEEEILKQRLDAISATLESAQVTYDELAELATNTRDAEALARVIGAKLQFLQQMTNERLQINDALTRISKNKAEEADRINYSFFTVRVYEQKVFDPKGIADTWERSMRQFVNEANGILIGLSLGLIINALVALQLALYLFLLLVVVKFGWRFVRDFWRK